MTGRHVHGHVHTHTHSHGHHSHGHRHSHSHSHGGKTCGVGHCHSNKSLFKRITEAKYFYHSIAGVVVLLLMSLWAPAILLALAIVGVNAVIEMHKSLTAGIPLDIEILTLGVAYLAAHGNPFAAGIVAVTGPFLAELCRGHICTGSMFRPFGLLVIIPVAAALGPSFAGLLGAVVVGVIANYIRVALTAHSSDLISSAISRTTQVLVALHILFILF